MASREREITGYLDKDLEEVAYWPPYGIKRDHSQRSKPQQPDEGISQGSSEEGVEEQEKQASDEDRRRQDENLR